MPEDTRGGGTIPCDPITATSNRTGLNPATSVPGLGSPLPHLNWGWARPRRIGSGLGPCSARCTQRGFREPLTVDAMPPSGSRSLRASNRADVRLLAPIGLRKRLRPHTLSAARAHAHSQAQTRSHTHPRNRTRTRTTLKLQSAWLCHHLGRWLLSVIDSCSSAISIHPLQFPPPRAQLDRAAAIACNMRSNDQGGAKACITGPWRRYTW